MQARFTKGNLERLLGPGTRVFLDSDDLQVLLPIRGVAAALSAHTNLPIGQSYPSAPQDTSRHPTPRTCAQDLNLLLQHVRDSDYLIIFQTAGVLLRP